MVQTALVVLAAAIATAEGTGCQCSCCKWVWCENCDQPGGGCCGGSGCSTGAPGYCQPIPAELSANATKPDVDDVQAPVQVSEKAAAAIQAPAQAPVIASASPRTCQIKTQKWEGSTTCNGHLDSQDILNCGSCVSSSDGGRIHTCNQATGKMTTVKYSGSSCTGTTETWTKPLNKCTYWNSKSYAMILCYSGAEATLNSTYSLDSSLSLDEPFPSMMVGEMMVVGAEHLDATSKCVQPYGFCNRTPGEDCCAGSLCMPCDRCQTGGVCQVTSHTAEELTVQV